MRTFKNITVGEYQQLYAIHKGADDEIDKSVQSVAILTGKTRWEVEEMPLDEFRRTAKEITVIYFSALEEQKPKSYIKVAGKWYKICLNPRQITAGQYIDLQHFLKGNQIENLHKLFACLLIPVKKFGFFYSEGKYNGENHQQLSEDIVNCKFIEVHSTCVFFSKLWKLSIKAMEPFLSKEIQKMIPSLQKMDLQTIMDGFLTQSQLQSLKT